MTSTALLPNGRIASPYDSSGSFTRTERALTSHRRVNEYPRIRLLHALVSSSLLSPIVAGAQVLTTRDSTEIGGQIALHIAAYLRANKGADSSNAVCVKLESDVGGAFLHSLDSSLNVTIGGALVAPLKVPPLRSVKVVALTRSRDTVFATVVTSSGGLLAGEMESGVVGKVPVVRTRDGWLRHNINRALVGDGYIRVDKPSPPVPPKCL